jgi:hypothetical protein
MNSIIFILNTNILFNNVKIQISFIYEKKYYSFTYLINVRFYHKYNIIFLKNIYIFHDNI